MRVGDNPLMLAVIASSALWEIPLRASVSFTIEA
jgi:hypothetical protein